ncbi:MAG TPA: lysophospholipid acyltransferase family protein [Pseudomonadales bacterium]
MLMPLRTILFYMGYAVTLVFHATLCVLVSWALPLATRYRLATMWNRFVVWWLKVTCGVRFRVTGAEHVPDGPFVLLSNHQSPWETIFLYYYFVPLCAILKKELLRIPFFGWALATLKPIAIDRSKGRSALNSLMVEGPQRLAMGLSVLVFPEGTRTEVGEQKKFFPGGAGLAIKAGALVLPVAHNAGLCWPARRFAKRPGLIDVVIGKPIPTAGRESRELTEEVQNWIRQALPQQVTGPDN